MLGRSDFPLQMRFFSGRHRRMSVRGGRQDTGASLPEYLILLVAISLALVVITQSTSSQINQSAGKVAFAMGGGTIEGGGAPPPGYIPPTPTPTPTPTPLGGK